MVFQFTNHSNLPKGSACPIHPMFKLYGKLISGQSLTPEEKLYITERLYGVGGSHSSMYKLMGFCAPFYKVFPKILVKQYDHWQEYYAPNKSTLRKVLYGHIQEMTYVNKKS